MQGRRSEFQSAGARGMELPKLKAIKRNFAKLLQKLGMGGGGLYIAKYLDLQQVYSQRNFGYGQCVFVPDLKLFGSI